MPQVRLDRSLELDQLEKWVRQLAESHTIPEQPTRRPSLLSRLHDLEALLRAAHEYFASASGVQLALSYAAEWLLDNFYIVEQTLHQIREHMPERYYRQLPTLDTPPLEGYPRVYSLAVEVIRYFEGQLDLDRVTRSVEAYQHVTSLTMGELWALPTMLRLGILEDLGWAVARIVAQQTGRTEDLPQVVERLLPEDLDEEAVVAHCIVSLRVLATDDWKKFFESVSRVEQVLSRDPLGIYAHMDFDTRDRYRGVVEQIARATGRDEEEIAREAIHLAEEAHSSPRGKDQPRIAHVGFYLLDAGRGKLEARLGYRPFWPVRLSRWLLGHPTGIYLGGITLITLLISLGLVWYAHAVGGTPAQLVGVGLLAILPASAVAAGLANWIVTHTVPPRLLPRMESEEGLSSDCRTLVVFPVILSDVGEIDHLLGQLELTYLSNEDPYLHFVLLADLYDAPQEHMPGDDELVEKIRVGTEALNRKYGQYGIGPFCLLYRGRKFNQAEGYWMGWERKRGKLVELNRLIAGEETPWECKVGRVDFLPEVKYVITLDADTLLPRGSARRLVATLAHPLNRAQFDPESGAVVAGYTVLQPRLEIRPTSAGRSLFTRAFSGDTSLDLYTRAVSDVYQDLFGEGIYAGKGIYDAAAFRSSLDGRVPENALLSHDLFEGIHGRAGLVTDVVLYEDFPTHYLAYMRRLHRWARGDWQLLPWLLSRVPVEDGRKRPNNLSALDRWKILDNLRRSLLVPALLAFLVAGWLWLPGPAAVWTLVGLLTLAIPVFTGLLSGLVQGLQGASMTGALPAVRMASIRWLLAFLFLPYETLVLVDAIAPTLHRIFFSRKRLLQWTTAAHTIRLFGRETRLGVLWRQMGGASLLSLALALLVYGFNLPAFLAAAPLLFVWVISPYIVHWVSRPIQRKQAALSDDECRKLYRLARRTWLYFEQFVGPDDQWLPPDHFQESPLGLVAHRTSPTNVGLLLLSTLAAYDLGYIGPLDLVLRLRPTFEGMGRLERYQGHLLNWYDTHNLRPLPPRYVSTVDSGNLAACLLVLEQGCNDLCHTPIMRWQRLQGVLDTLDVLAEIAEGIGGDGAVLRAVAALRDYLAQVRQEILAVRDDPSSWASLLEDLGSNSWQELERLLIALVEAGSHKLEAATLHDLHVWSERVDYHLFRMQGELDMLSPWLLALSRPPALFSRSDVDPTIVQAWQSLVAALPVTPPLDEVADVCRAGRARLKHLQELLDTLEQSTSMSAKAAGEIQEARDWCSRLADDLYSARMAVESLLIGLRDLGEQAEEQFRRMDFAFLFNPQRQVFHIGYNVEGEALDGNCYDLLASEARIASLLAIAKGDVPQSHWLHLGRSVARVDGSRALLSWGGTMFEYLMPVLLVRNYEGALLEESCRAAVERQIDYARQQGVPWGISESGYYRFDAGMHYQYQGFGVPGLGFKRGLSEDLVITPYASLLALSLYPRKVVRNIEHLAKLEMLGRYGFYEAIDYTSTRLPQDQKSAIVYSYMVHHQGMALLALTNYLQGDVMLNRFHADLRVQSVQLLLQEQVVRQAPVEVPHPEEVSAVSHAQPQVAITPWRVRVAAPIPAVHLLSNGRYSVLITGSGGGYSHCTLGTSQEVDLTRWRADTTLDDWGTWIYVQDQDSGELWSVSPRPTDSVPESQEILFYAHQAEFGRRDHDISLRMEVAVPPDDLVEVRRITLTNHSDRLRRLRLTSYAEVVLASQNDDQRHQAFNKLFIESEYVPGWNGLLFRRRPRSSEEEPIYLAHLLVTERGIEVTGDYESDRARFLGRGGTPRAPAALLSVKGEQLSGTTGATLDPIMALGQEVELKPRSAVQVAFLTLAARTHEEMQDLVGRYQAWAGIGRAFSRARASSQLALHRLDLATSDLERVQQLLAVLLYPHAAMRAEPATLESNCRGQPGLWAYAISGDYPILLVRVGEEEELDLVRELLQAHVYWRDRGLKIDLVIVNQRETAYDQELHGQLHRLIHRMGSDGWLNRRGGIFVLRADQMGETDRVLLETAARAVLDGNKGPLAEQLRRLRRRSPLLPRFTPTLASPEDREPTPPLPRPADLLFDNGLGGFTPDGREYVIYLERPPGRAKEASQWTPNPWINVIANRNFGFIVSESGGGHTWAVNSGENRLTPWRNDPVTDMPGEVVYLRDEETGQGWSPTPLPAPASAPYLVRHGAGYSVFEHHSYGLKQRLCLFVVPDAPVKVVQLRLENTWDHMRRITATFYVEWVLGTSREVMQQYVIPEFDTVSNALLVRNPYKEEFAERVAFVAASTELHGLTADRTEFLGREGSLRRPAALDRIGLTGTVRAGLDPCAVLQVHLDIAAGETKEIFFLLGQGASRRETLRLVRQYRDPGQVEAAWEGVGRLWDDLLGTVTVQTPDPAMDVLLNRWLLYQALSCRIWGRSALYQSSGAFGYRDQLQDVMALMHAEPSVMRDHILEAARHQFEAGDVLHWWHPPSGRGVRTRCSDDLLWLPFVTAGYVAVTGDEAILSQTAPFLRGKPLDATEMERYGHYEVTEEEETLYEHCRRALKKGTTAGPHGLPLIGSHDWNDGLSRVGVEGKGESVWLGWFLYATLTRFAPLCERMGDAELAATYRRQAEELRQALEEHAWDWGWYRRAYYDDGTPLGSSESDEAQIDSVAQSWAVLSGAADPKRAETAMEAVVRRLVRRNDHLIALFDPPFDKTEHDPGYIKGYPPGIRENGGQYTHAALWAVWAFAELGDGDLAEELFRLLNPIYHGDTVERMERYRVEPYVVAADIYSVRPYVGRGGWSWYTGSAGWMYRLGLEAILGLHRVGDGLRIDPCIPNRWRSYGLTYRFGKAVYRIRVGNPEGVNCGVKRVVLDGSILPGDEIPLVDDGQQHEVRVLMGEKRQ